MAVSDAMVDQILSALRRVMRAVDLHSRQLVQSHGLTGPQALVLKAVRNRSLSAGALQLEPHGDDPQELAHSLVQVMDTLQPYQAEVARIPGLSCVDVVG